MRTLSSPSLAAIAARTAPLALLVEMDLSQQLLMNSATVDLTIGALTYLGTKGLGKVEAIRETPAELAQLKFEISGVPAAQIALALAEPVQGKAVRVKLAIFDPSTYLLLETQLRWSGLLDVMTVSDGVPLATIAVTAEHAGIDLLRPVASVYSDAEQQRLNPGDLFCQFVSDQADQRVIWPAASWGRQ